MATIRGTTDERVFRLLNWKGLNENPDGDTKLELGEASVIRNFQITRDGNLKKRPGLDQVSGIASSYSLDVAATAEVAKTDHHVCAQLSMKPNAAVTADGFVTTSGIAVTVTADNWNDYVNYYWVYDKYHTWKFVSLDYDSENDIYSWNMKRVTALGAEDLLYMDTSVNGLWSGNVNGHDYMVASMEGRLYKLFMDGNYGRSLIGTIGPGFTPNVHMFGYSNKLYILGNGAYKEWDGTTLREVVGYIPLVVTNSVGDNGGQTLEQINKLSPKRRVWITTDGTTKRFALPEKDLASIDYVKNRATDTDVPVADYVTDTTAGTMTFRTAPAAAVNSYEIGYSVPAGETQRGEVEAMRFSELFNGANDNRVFLYGDGTNKAIYSGLDYNGNPRADYFPDMNELIIGEANTPITGMIRHYSRLLVFKTHSAYSVQYSVETLVDGTTTPTYYVTPVNREIGHAAPGQVRLVLNAPITLHGNDLYEWRNTSSYSSNLSIDERQAKRISDRINATLKGFNLEKCYCWDDNDAQEYYICNRDDRIILVYNYAMDVWYVYTGFEVSCMCNYRGKLYVGDGDGRIHCLDPDTRTDNGTRFDCYWESGSLAFDREFMRKYSAMLWVGIKPESKAEVNVTVQTDRKSSYTEKLVASSLATFIPADFSRWSFATNRKPRQKRLKIKAKKFVYYKLIFFTQDKETTVTLLNSDIRVRYTGYAR